MRATFTGAAPGMVSTFLLSALLSTPAVAKDRPTVAVVGVHDDSLELQAQREAVESLRAALEGGKRFEVLGPDAVARAITGREELIVAETYLSSGRRVLEDGRLLHDQAQPEEAVPALIQAEETLIAIMPAADASRELWEAYLYLGASHQELGEDDAAKAAWAKAVALNPERQPDAARIAPTIVQGYQEAKTEALKTPGSLTVKLGEGQAEIFVNGQSIGPSPAKVEGWPAGPIYVRARGEGGTNAYTRADILPGDETTVTLTMSPLSLPAAGDSAFARTRATTDLYKTLGQQTKADLVLLAGGIGGEGQLQLYSPPADAFSNALKLSYDGESTDELAKALPGLLDIVNDEGGLPAVATTPTAGPLDPSHNRLLAELLLDPKPLAPVAPPTSRRTGLLMAGGVGALIVGASVGGYLLATRGGPNRGTIIIGPVPE